MSPSIVVILPMFNEEEHVGALIADCKPVVEEGLVAEVVVVDDGSTDGTPAILAAAEHCTVITHPTNQGCGDAIRSGYRHALDQGYDICVIMAGNGKDDPAEIERVVAPILAGEADYVQGSRYLPGGRSENLPRHRNVAIRLFTWAFSLALWRRYTDCTNGFRAYRTSILSDERIGWDQPWLGPGYELEYYMHYRVAQLGYRVTEVPVSKVYRQARAASHTKVRPRDWITILRPLVYLRLGLKR
jgi:dolichol-phosphate mannosyltransferase